MCDECGVVRRAFVDVLCRLCVTDVGDRFCVDVATEGLDVFEEFSVSQGHPPASINNYAILSVWKYLSVMTPVSCHFVGCFPV